MGEIVHYVSSSVLIFLQKCNTPPLSSFKCCPNNQKFTAVVSLGKLLHFCLQIMPFAYRPVLFAEIVFFSRQTM